eukprot:434170-Prymnesium_polylepis.1
MAAVMLLHRSRISARPLLRPLRSRSSSGGSSRLHSASPADSICCRTAPTSVSVSSHGSPQAWMTASPLSVAPSCASGER